MKIYKTLLKIGVIVVSTFILLVLFFLIAKRDELKGIWDCDGITLYQFDGKGKGMLIVPDSTYVFDYEIIENQVQIDFEDEGVRDYRYRFSVNKEELILYGSEEMEAFLLKFSKVK